MLKIPRNVRGVVSQMLHLRSFLLAMCMCVGEWWWPRICILSNTLVRVVHVFEKHTLRLIGLEEERTLLLCWEKSVVEDRTEAADKQGGVERHWGADRKRVFPGQLG